MKMNVTSTILQMISLAPPELPYENRFQGWFPLTDSDAVINYIVTALWDQEAAPVGWQVARLSPAVYVYQEEQTRWKVATKFYQSKTGKDSDHHAKREFQRTQRAWACFNPDYRMRSVQPLGVVKGVLFLEYVSGLTLEDKISIRRNQPGELLDVLETVSKFLAQLHMNCLQPEAPADFGPAADYAYKVIDNLARHGVLQKHPGVKNGFVKLVEKWGQEKLMWDFDPTINHGDATTANFILPPPHGVVAIDWERSELADPAADLGRLMAEVAHSIHQNGGDFAEAQVVNQHITDTYLSSLPAAWEAGPLLQRALFYQAASTLRIARNGWLSHQDRFGLILEAFALLSQYP
jgi:aminoglycoside phosphotransferase (APT) family kinase protein